MTEEDASCKSRRTITPDRRMVLIPAFNEEAALPPLLAEIAADLPEYETLVVDDGSHDETFAAARNAGVRVLRLPCNLGVGGAVQAGLRLADREGYARVVRIDADGQHAPAHIPRLFEVMERTGADLVIGSRHLGGESYKNSALRSLGARYLRAFLSLICRQRVTDPTSGFHLFNRYLIRYFSERYPSDYPEPESLALLRRQGYSFAEADVDFRPRRQGASSLSGATPLVFALKVTVALLADRARSVDRRYSREALLETLA
jgi:glycosyltransferase involved in cell wall biosynthesis